jgi:tRNA(Arg) A34 adenosine deaminase TadA
MLSYTNRDNKMMADDFELNVQQQVKRLKNSSYRTIENEVAEKRVSWYQENRQNSYQKDRPSPRTAFESLFFKYMGLSKHDLPIILETEGEIVWLSKNKCPTLEACGILGLDTRHICRAVYEKSTQAFVSQLDPQLRFLRSYEEIRPHSDHCKEMIVRVNFEGMMTLAIEEARISKQEGNKGYGAVVALGNRIIGKAHDTTVTEKDPSLHAEVNAIRQAVRALADTNLSGAILFSSREPCPMCSSLAVWANVTSIVYGASIQETARFGRSRIEVSSREITERSPVMIEIIGDVMGDICRSLYT